MRIFSRVDWRAAVPGLLVITIALALFTEPPGSSPWNRDNMPSQVVFATHNSACRLECDDGKEFDSIAFVNVHVVPVRWQTPTPPPVGTPTATPHVVSWQEHKSGNIAPVSVKVSWGGTVETMEIHPNGTTSGTHPNIKFHTGDAIWCDDFGSSGGVTFAGGGAPCIESIDYDIDWNETVSGSQWDWFYFWVRDPDFIAMKTVDKDDCPDTAWPYEYVNRGPLYSICQSFSETYGGAHGQTGGDIVYEVLYQPGAPASPTPGSTPTPPAGATPCNPHLTNCP